MWSIYIAECYAAIKKNEEATIYITYEWAVEASCFVKAVGCIIICVPVQTDEILITNKFNG